MNTEAKRYLENHDHVKALELYFTALGICNMQNLSEDVATIYHECAGLLLQTNSYYLAYRHQGRSQRGAQGAFAPPLFPGQEFMNLFQAYDNYQWCL